MVRGPPTITTVARDRSKEFAAAISQALPNTQQVADRWHLAHNLTEALDHVIAARRKHLLPTFRVSPVPIVSEEALHSAQYAIGTERYQQVLASRRLAISWHCHTMRCGVCATGMSAAMTRPAPH